MKKIIAIQILTLIISLKCSFANAQPPAGTGAYLQTIVNNKAQYIGQPFSVLLNDLQMPIKFFSPFAASKRSKETSTAFAFYFPQNANEINKIYPCLEIYWQTDLNAYNSMQLYTQYRSVGWNSVIASSYSSGIIADIKLTN